MAFQPILSLIDVKKDGSSITLRDTTGTYNSTTNPGGYGSPNPNISSRIGLVWRYWPDVLGTARIVSTSISLQAADYEVTPETFGLTGVFEDGVHQFKYLIFYAVSGTFALTNGSKLVTRTTGSVDLTMEFDSTLYTSIELDGVIYDVDFTKTRTATTLYLTEAFTGTTITDYSINKGALGDLKVLVDAVASKIFCKQAHALSLEPCECNETIDNALKMLMYLQAANSEMLCKHYTKAHNLVTYINLQYSLTENCGC